MISKKNDRLGEEATNNQGCLMKIIEYDNVCNIIVEFQDKYKAKVHSNYQCFRNGCIKNPYHPFVYNVGMIGNKYPSRINKVMTKEYRTWCRVLKRCFDDKYKNEHYTYEDATCNEWLLFENFYEWLHNQENFDKWNDNDRWDIDKDIIKKGNKIYSPDLCLLVPHNVNALFVKKDINRGSLPIGVTKHKDKYRARCENQLTGKREHLGLFATPTEAFNAYKNRKENLIKQIAEIEFVAGNITKECYNAMLKYEI